LPQIAQIGADQEEPEDRESGIWKKQNLTAEARRKAGKIKNLPLINTDRTEDRKIGRSGDRDIGKQRLTNGRRAEA